MLVIKYLVNWLVYGCIYTFVVLIWSPEMFWRFWGMFSPKCFIQQSPQLNILLEQSLVIHNRCSTGVVSHSVHESLGFIKPNLGWTPCCLIDKHIALTLRPLLLSGSIARPFIYTVVCVDYNFRRIDAGSVWAQSLWLWFFIFNNQLISHWRAFLASC